MTSQTLSKTRLHYVLKFLLLTFSISWIFALMMYLFDITYGSTISIVMTAAFYMPGPALAAVIFHKYILKESFEAYNFTLKGIAKWWVFLYTPLLFILLTATYFFTIFLLGNVFNIEGIGLINFSTEFIYQELLKMSGGTLKLEELPFPLDAYILLPIGLFGAFISAYSLNLPFMLGEELGWRGFMWRELKSLGFFKANIIIGFFWGIWHAPLIMMGHNYPEYPILGVFIMTLFCMASTFSFTYLRIKTNTIWGPCIWHGMLNGSASLLLLFVDAENSIIGSIAGIAGAFSFVSLYILMIIFDKKNLK